MRLLFFGPPGSGKGTQATLLAQRLGVPAISTGEMLRQAVACATELGKRCADIMGTGALVDDATMADVVRDRLAQPDARQGFILDGYPRNRAQAETLAQILRERGHAVEAALFLDVPEEELVRRMTGRRELAGRADDREEVVRERLRIYREQTAPLVDYYEERGLLRHIDGNRPVEAVTEAIAGALAVAPAAAAARSAL
jgi:adenylate kinase